MSSSRVSAPVSESLQRPSSPTPEEMQSALGNLSLPQAELAKLAESITQRHRSVLRLRRDTRIEALPFELAPVPWYALAHCTVDDQARPSRTIDYAAADFYLQDAGSLLVLAACDADTDRFATGLAQTTTAGGPLICDLCAAPGGKATALVEAIGQHGFVVANEPIRSRIPALAYNLARTGSTRWAITNLDPWKLAARCGTSFDLVLVDAPCSGQALMSRGKQNRSSMSAVQIEHSAARQRRILAAATELLKPGGRLIYSTCTFAVAENEDQVQWLTEDQAISGAPVARLANHQSPLHEACYRIWPHRDGSAGSFAASMTKSWDANAAVEPELPSHKKSRDQSPPRLDDLRCDAEVQAWLQQVQERYRVRMFDAIAIGWPHDAPKWIDPIACAGPELVHRTGRTWKPAHGLALRRLTDERLGSAHPLDTATAATFLSGAAIPCTARGWHTVAHQDRPLGWIKADGRIGKNHLPAVARMLCVTGQR